MLKINFFCFRMILSCFRRFRPVVNKQLIFYACSSVNVSQKRQCGDISQSKLEIFKEIFDESEDKDEYLNLRSRYFLQENLGHQVIILQPFLRTGNSETTKELMLDESKALIETLNWKVVNSMCIGLSSFKKAELFGSGKLAEIQELISNDPRITAVFLSLYQLTTTQRILLENRFSIPVIDRYNLVLQIFHQHARTREAKLQVALAEIPYIRNRICVDYEREQNSKHSKSNMGESSFETRRNSLKKLERNIRSKIDKLRAQRKKLREGKNREKFKTCAVVGYTNCGKTSLIKALTGEDLEPKNQLFATLDVTCHLGVLPSNLKCIYIDTVGFISDIPTPLIASFSATLEDAVQADMILHVRDLSHPDTLHQNSQVLATFNKLNFPLSARENIITVGNKIDKVGTETIKSLINTDVIPVSATLNIGLTHLSRSIERLLIKLSGRRRMVYRVRTGGEEQLWLRRNGTVISSAVAEDLNYSDMTVLLSPEEIGKFHATFINV